MIKIAVTKEDRLAYDNKPHIISILVKVTKLELIKILPSL